MFSPLLRRWLKEPLIHFAVLGAGLFALHARVAPEPANRIVVAASFVDALRREHAQRTGAPPTPDEERGLIERFVEEEILYREAVALGLDRGDPIVRRRLAQKMSFLAEDTAAASEPTDAELDAFLAAHADRYREPERASFRHVFASRDRRGAAAEGDARRLLDDLRGGADPASIGDPFLQGSSFARRSPADIEAVFGPAFAAAVRAAPTGSWSGPFASSFGAHAVLVTEREPAATPKLATLRARVRQDYLDERRTSAAKTAALRLRPRYSVDVERPR